MPLKRKTNRNRMSAGSKLVRETFSFLLPKISVSSFVLLEQNLELRYNNLFNQWQFKNIKISKKYREGHFSLSKM